MTNVCMSQCFDVGVSVSEAYLGTAHFDGIIRLWSVKSGDSLHEVKNAHDD